MNTDKSRADARAEVATWIFDELKHYADPKWSGVRADHEKKSYEEGIAVGSLWREQIDTKIHRAEVLGFDTPLGTQALLKGLVTMFELCVTIALTNGLPEAGHPSGELFAPEAGEVGA